MAKRVCLAGLFALLAFAAAAQDGSGFSLGLEPAITFPFPGTASAGRFAIGAQGSLCAEYVFPRLPFLLAGGSLDYAYLPYGSSWALQEVGLSAGGGFRLRFLARFAATAYGRGGYALGMLGAVNAPNPYLRAGLDLSCYLTPTFRLSAAGEYVHHFALSEALYQGIAARLSAGFNFSQRNQRSRLEIRDILLQPVFPVFYKYYNDHPVGTARVRNGERGPVKDLKVSLFVRQYMDAPKECVLIPRLEPGEEREVSLYALFTPSILAVLETTKAQAEITAAYTYLESEREARAAGVASIHHRNAMSWDDDRKAASFTTVNDPNVLRFSKQIAGQVRAAGWEALDPALRQAVGMAEALGLYGIRYVVDPNTPFVEYKQDAAAVDYLQFPIQTLQFRAGDCDDLSILTAALLEAAGIQTAFITVPGHIYIAFALGLPEEQARQYFTRPEDLVVKLGKAWVPVEVTALGDGFLRAWQLGARQWRDAEARGEAALLPLHEAWKLYEPVALFGAEAPVELPSSERLLARYGAAMQAFVDREVGPRAEALGREMAAAPSDPRPANRLGVLYARYGLYDKAVEAFRASVQRGETPAGYINLAQVLMLRKDFQAARAAYTRALRLAPGEPKVLIGLVRASYELEDRAAAGRWLEDLTRLDPQAAQRLSYVRTGDSVAGRASEAGEEGMSWEQ